MPFVISNLDNELNCIKLAKKACGFVADIQRLSDSLMNVIHSITRGGILLQV
jgi:hypothetical protein